MMDTLDSLLQEAERKLASDRAYKRLRDAAPDLLTALQALLSQIEADGYGVDKYGKVLIKDARAAIAKATGA